jgi:hypothetical protein
MLPFNHDSTSSDEEDAPESFSLVQSKRTIQEQDGRMNKIQTAAKQKKKEENRERDKKLKERANGKGKGKEVTEDKGDAGARMERAMREAEEEMDADDNDEADSEVQDLGLGEEDEESSSEDEEPVDIGDREMDEDENAESCDDEDILATDHKLPDHLFSSIATSKSFPSPSLKRLSVAPKPQKSRSKGRKRTAKDLIIGQVPLHK